MAGDLTGLARKGRSPGCSTEQRCLDAQSRAAMCGFSGEVPAQTSPSTSSTRALGLPGVKFRFPGERFGVDSPGSLVRGQGSGSLVQTRGDCLEACSGAQTRAAQVSPSVCVPDSQPGPFLITHGALRWRRVDPRQRPSGETEATLCILIKEAQRPKAFGSYKMDSPKRRQVCAL